MEPVATMEIVSAIYVCLSLISQILEEDQSKSSKQIRLCSIMTLCWLLSDAMTFILNGPQTYYWIMYILGLMSYTLNNIVLMGYMKYCSMYFSEMIRISKWAFRIPIIILVLNTVLVTWYYVTGKVFVVQENGYFAVIGTLPLYIFAIYIFMLLYPLVVALLNRKIIGRKVIAVFAALSMLVFSAILLLILTEFDCTVVMGGITVVFFVTFLQNNSAKVKLDNARIVAEKANKAKSDFLFSMSHDIRTPMNAILGYADIAMRHSDDSERVNDCVKKIKQSGGHLLNLINDILEMSRIESGKLEISENPTDIRDIIKSVSQMSETLAVSKDINFINEIGNIRNPYVLTDELHVNEILINLISNAVKYNRPGGSVEFRIEQIESAIDGMANLRFTVKDNGIGMSEEFQKHLFEDFARENTTTVSKQEGAGLGLSIVKKIIDLSRGTITVTSKKDEGSTFIVVLPMHIMSEEKEKKFREARENNEVVWTNADLAGRKVLLVEDNDFNREIAAEILAEMGLEIENAEDGAVAVRKVKEKGVDYYDYILMDIQMPVMNGYEATKEIRSMPGGRSIPIIALSANAFREDVEKSLTVGMNAHVAKPINIKSLMNTMQMLVR